MINLNAMMNSSFIIRSVRPASKIVRVSTSHLPTNKQHFIHHDASSQTVRDIIINLTKKVGAEDSFFKTLDRASLCKMLPLSQDELPTRTMKDSWDYAIIPLGQDKRLREKYVTFLGGVRIGRLLEDLDVFAVWLCYKHIYNPRQQENLPSPYSIVTALVDRIDFNRDALLSPDRNIRLSGNVSWAGRSSLETVINVEQDVNGKWEQIFRSVFVMVARDPLNQGSAFVNPLVSETPEEDRLYQQGEINKQHRKRMQEESLYKVPPSASESSLVHDLFMSISTPLELSLSTKILPSDAIWMGDTKLKNMIICHPEHRNRFKKVFGGFIMRQALELGWACTFVSSKMRPRILHIDDIMFKRPVEIGSLLYLNAQIVYTEGKHIQVSTKASVMDVVTGTSNLTNIFHFTFEVDQDVPRALPKSYNEAMLYLEGRRHYQLVRGIRKYYGQGEKPFDSKL